MLLARPIIVAASFVMAVLAWGTVFYGHSVYMDQLMRAHGWSASLISTAILVFWLASLPGTLSVGALVDRYGPAPVVALGGACIGGGLAAMSGLTEPWQLFVIYAVMGFGYPALAAAAISATLAPWYARGFPTALGIALTGASVGGAAVPLLIVHSTAVHGFISTVLIMGGAVLLITLSIAGMFALLGKPPRDPQRADEAVAFSATSVLAEWRFWRIALAAAFGLGGQVGFLAHQVPIISTQLDHVTAPLTVTIVAVASALGRLIIGVAGRFLPAAALAGLSYALYGAGIALLPGSDTAQWVIAGCALAGLFVGAIVMLPPILVRETYGTANFGRTYAMVNVVMYILAGLTPWIVGLMRDGTGSYTSSLWMLVAMEGIAVVLISGILLQHK